MKTLVLELGSWRVRYRWLGSGKGGEVLNVLGRLKTKVVIGDKLRQNPTYVMSRPSQRGVIVDWELQKTIIADIVLNLPAGVSTGDVRVVVSVAPVMAQTEALRTEILAVFFEDFRFSQVVILDSSLCVQFCPEINQQFNSDDWQNPCGLIIDVAFASVRVVPVFNTAAIPGASVRMDVGGRVLNNFLKETLAATHVDLDDNPLLVERLRELVCYCRADEEREDESVHVQLPTFVDAANCEPGIVADLSPSSTSVSLRRERWIIPELLFCPEIAGIQQCGVVEATQTALLRCPPELRPAIIKKVMITGGLSKTPNFVEKFTARFRATLPTELAENFRVVHVAATADTLNFRGAVALAESEADLQNLGVFTKQMFFGS